MLPRSSILLLVPAIVLAFPLLAQNSAEESAANLTRMHQAWGEKASSPGTSLIIKEASRSGNTVRFRLTATGVPKDSVFTLVAWPVTQRGPVEALKGVTIDETGLAICAGRPGTCGSANNPNDPIDLPMSPVPGEPIRLGLVSSDGATKLFAKLVPVPIRGEDQGCRVNAALLTPGAELIEIEGTGFPAGGEITMDSVSEGERHAGKGTADSTGKYVSALLPYKQGLASGTVKVTLKSANCSPTVSVPWGKARAVVEALRASLRHQRHPFNPCAFRNIDHLSHALEIQILCSAQENHVMRGVFERLFNFKSNSAIDTGGS